MKIKENLQDLKKNYYLNFLRIKYIGKDKGAEFIEVLFSVLK
ncbi:hypothetical protein [Polaribacter sp. WD7]|nr:hypothetical protein [Polaribacter sp. WD7]